MLVKEFVRVVKEIVKLPMMTAYPLFNKLTGSISFREVITKEQFETWYETHSIGSLRNSDKFTLIYLVLLHISC